MSFAVAPAGRCRIGIGKADITPPPDAYHRNWGAALHDRAEGIHRPLSATALLLQAASGGPEHLLLTFDLGWLRPREMRILHERVATATGIDSEYLIITFSHTHAAVQIDLTRSTEPGGEHLAPYFDALPECCAKATAAARTMLQPADLSYSTGRCNLAWQRDFYDEERSLFACGTNPLAAADDTLLAIRCTAADGQALANLINYGCHPTTLAWDNKLISPDYIGAMREVVENTTNAPCAFVLSACAELGPRDSYTGDIEIVERNGRQLGYAALSALESLPPPATRMHYQGPVLSGATLAHWTHEALDAQERESAQTFRSTLLELELPFRDLPTREELENQLSEWQTREASALATNDGDQLAESRAHIERIRRAMRRLEELPTDPHARYPIRLWQIGAGIFAFLSGEPYSLLQVELRRRFPQTPIVVSVLCNEPYSYILPRDQYGIGLYQDEVATLAPGALEHIIDAISDQLREWSCS